MCYYQQLKENLFYHETRESVKPVGIKGFQNMRVHRLGYIQARSLEFWLSDDAVRKAYQVGKTLMEGIKREVAIELGLDINDAVRMRLVYTDVHGNRLIRVESDWVKPTRS
jgi:glycine cleavage system aminomethyltransferase T